MSNTMVYNKSIFPIFWLFLVTVRKQVWVASTIQSLFSKAYIQINKCLTISTSRQQDVIFYVSCVNQHCKLFYIVYFFGPANFIKYWDLLWVQYLYAELGKKESLENQVDRLWTAICTELFLINEDYLISDQWGLLNF